MGDVFLVGKKSHMQFEAFSVSDQKKSFGNNESAPGLVKQEEDDKRKQKYSSVLQHDGRPDQKLADHLGQEIRLPQHNYEGEKVQEIKNPTSVDEDFCGGGAKQAAQLTKPARCDKYTLVPPVVCVHIPLILFVTGVLMFGIFRHGNSLLYQLAQVGTDKEGFIFVSSTLTWWILLMFVGGQKSLDETAWILSRRWSSLLAAVVLAVSLVGLVIPVGLVALAGLWLHLLVSFALLLGMVVLLFLFRLGPFI